MVGAQRISGWLARDRPARISACSQKPSPTIRCAFGRSLTADIEPIYQACQDPQVQEWTVAIPVPYARADAESFVTHICPLGWAEDREYTWGIEEPGTHEFLGVIGLRIQDDDCSEVGYWLAPGARGRGVMTQALSAVCEFAFGRLGHDVVKWQAIVGNEASRRVAERVGFEIGPPVRGLLRRRGERLDGWIGHAAADRHCLASRRRSSPTASSRCGRRAAADLEVLPDLVDDEVLAWTGVPGRSRAELRRWLDVVRRPDRPPAARFAITDAAGRLQGFVRLSREPISESVTVGWWLGPGSAGPGLRAPRGRSRARLGGRARARTASRPASSTATARRSRWPSGWACGPRDCAGRTGRPRNAGDPRRDTWLYSLVPSDPGWPTASAGLWWFERSRARRAARQHGRPPARSRPRRSCRRRA